jgi:DNA-binding CsgD family transcriptional regulator
MGRVAESDLRRVFGFLGTVRAGSPDDPLPRSTLIALRDVIGADEAEYFELGKPDRAVIALTTSDDVESVPGTDEAMLAFGGQNPVGWRRFLPAHGAMRLSARIRRREFERLAFFGEFMAPNGLRDILKIWLVSDSNSAACVQLWRRSRDFSRREQDLLGVLQHDLIRLRALGLAGATTRPPGAGALTAREAEVLIWAVRGHSHEEIARRLGTSTGTVGKHLEHAYATLGVRSRAQVVERVLLSGPLDAPVPPGAASPPVGVDRG